MPTSGSLTPSQRSLHARLAALSRWANEDPTEQMARARAASPASIDYWAIKVDPDEQLPESERLRRAECARKAHFARMALRSAQARARRAS